MKTMKNNSITTTKNNNLIKKWVEGVKRHFFKENVQMPADIRKDT